MFWNRILVSVSIFYFLFLDNFTNSYPFITNYRIEFDTLYSPPATYPKNPKDLIYNVPLNQVTSEPIIIRIRDQLNNIVIPPGNPNVIVTTFDVLKQKGIKKDVWKSTGGSLCQRTLFGETWPKRFDRAKYKKICGFKNHPTVLMKKFVGEIIILDWLSHEHPAGLVPPNRRFLRVSIPALKLEADSNAFNITVPAASLVITQQPPKNITANTNFNISAEIRDNSSNIITEGLDSILFVEVTIPYKYKQFYHGAGKDMLLFKTDVRLGGDDVVTHQGTNDLVIREQASGGRVHFKNVRILDVILKLTLNLTMYMSKDPWLRSPNCKKCYDDIYEKDVDMYGFVRFRPRTAEILKSTPAVQLTNQLDVLAQTLDTLYLSSPFKQKGQPIIITRNFPFPGDMHLEARDQYGNRIYSGKYSHLSIGIETNPKGICISDDHSRQLREGYGKLVGSICQNTRSVHLIIYSRLHTSISVNSTTFKVVGDVHVAHFDNFQYPDSGIHIGSHVNSFIRFGAKAMHGGIVPGILKHLQMKLIVETIETHDDIKRTITMYTKFRERADTEPSEMLRAIIMPTRSKTTWALVREVNNDKIVMISLSQKEMDFTQYPFFSRICWNWNQIIHSFFIACKERKWTWLSILRMEDVPLPKSFHQLSSNFNISFNVDVYIPLFDPEKWQEGMLHDQMMELRDHKTRIIICFVNETYQTIVLTEAYRFGLASRDGYQWVFISDYARAFPIKSLCGVNVTCPEAFIGSLLFAETYNNSNFHSDRWYQTLDSFLSADRASLLGLDPVYPDTDTGSFMGLGYDAIWLFAESLRRIISRQLTVYSWRITEWLRKVSIKGLSGVVKLDHRGERSGFIGTIKVINPKLDSGIQLIRFVKQDELDVQVEYKYGINPKYGKFSNNLSLADIPLPYSEIYNLRNYVSYTGGINEENNLLMEDKTETWPSARIHRSEKVMPHFVCKNSCGNRVTIEDINLYDRGRCISMNTCDCFFGYYGDNCEQIMCTCLFGHCNKPFICTCTKGWSGKKCDKPICSNACINGKCVEPENCKCSSSGWIGSNCSTHIASIIVPIILILAFLIYLGYVGSFRLKKRLERNAALSNISWLIKWSEVTRVDNEKNKVGSHMLGRFYLWNRENWYVKHFNSRTIDMSDDKIRFEMVELVTFHHKNLIQYGGASLIYPNVCLFMEPAHKGSLEDILINETIQLGWDFRFSFMKDICNGMNFIHTKTDLPSHGRLKSSNCLVDNRWTVRLSGFGVPTMRYGPYAMLSDPEDPSVYYEDQKSLMWTAPELLGNITCLDDVRMGTKEGDVYSYGIIVSEIITRDVPFGFETNFLSIYSILDLIVDTNNPALKKDREVWCYVGGDLNNIRPRISNDQLPEKKGSKKKIRKMLDDIWNDEPNLRLSFQKVKPVLDEIHPTKGELLDTLIHLLESYSNNLEKVVVERTNDLQIEKAKIEHIISQMLPKKVAESLKSGEKVKPEIFDDVTVFYSDIVGFTGIAKKSEPMQVVDMLNTLYHEFDNILAQYDVYKVETIGDAYVVSSGVPERNGNLHAGEIATATIDIVCTISNLPIPHLPNEKLLLRIGIHSGPVVAGVVGLKMPRYTLFGETMQIAATMESSSKPMRIQISEPTAKIISELGGYFYKRRQEMKVCNQTITTHWLTGKEGYDKILPPVED